MSGIEFPVDHVRVLSRQNKLGQFVNAIGSQTRGEGVAGIVESKIQESRVFASAPPACVDGINVHTRARISKHEILRPRRSGERVGSVSMTFHVWSRARLAAHGSHLMLIVRAPAFSFCQSADKSCYGFKVSGVELGGKT